MAETKTDTQLSQATDIANQSPCSPEPVVGLYGVPGSGKTFLLDQLKHKLGHEFAFYDGSQAIANVVPGGLDAFKSLHESEQVHWRQVAIDTIKKECADSGQVAVVAGHLMFWAEEKEAASPVYTQNDLDTFTHILYLNVSAELVARQRPNDTERFRPLVSANHLRKWQQAEQTELHRLCRNHGIVFSVITAPQSAVLDTVLSLLRDFWHHTEKYNMLQAERNLDEILAAGRGRLETVLVRDADRTLASEDTGELFWRKITSFRLRHDTSSPLKTLFSGPMGYSYSAFRQATLLYEEVANDEEFDAICREIASAVTMHPESVSLLRKVADQEHVGAVIVSCGLRRVWAKVLEREGLSATVKVIGGGRITDGFVVTAAVKDALVARLRDAFQVYVCAFGDSPLDLEMLSKADEAIVVVGQEGNRSQTMDAALSRAIDNGSFRAYQALLPSNVSPRLDIAKLPMVHLGSDNFVNSVLCRRSRNNGLQVFHATDRKAAKLLMAPMRNAKFAGPALRESNHRVGWYLATEFLSDVIGIDEHPIPHVQGNLTNGYRFFHEQETSIVALMRGGEPMAFGVSEALPLAMFVHASGPGDVKIHHLQKQRSVILVDSIVNNGKTVIDFVQHIRNLHSTIHIVVVAGVVQAQSVSSDGSLAKAFGGDTNFSIVALRLSDNKFTGKGTTDTGNRLFGTTHLA